MQHQVERQCGPRILTFFLYLSDVEAGGGTEFPKLGHTITPKVGRAVLWPSVYDSDPMELDPRTNHAALPVEAGTKFAANGWVHLYDYVGTCISRFIFVGRTTEISTLFHKSFQVHRDVAATNVLESNRKSRYISNKSLVIRNPVLSQN
jgi:hypothetical protein